MSSATPDSVRAEIAEGALKVGNQVKASTGLAGTASTLLYTDSDKRLAQSGAVTASKPVYINSSSVPASGSIPFAFPVTGAASTSMSLFDITGTSSLSADEIYHLTLVQGAAVTTFTYSGFIRITATDSGGNITNGAYYIPFGLVT